MLDTHCHIDLYPDPTRVAQAAERAGVSTIVVTNLPSAYQKAAPHIKQFKRLRLALGLHPLVAEQHAKERAAFARLVSDCFYIGEVGLDFSREGYATKDIQIESFRFVLETLRDTPKLITLHSRRAEATVLEMLDEFGRTPVIFHWYSGPIKVLNAALEAGHYFSINPAMTQSPGGQKIITALPPERILTETDGPFMKVGTRTAVPADVVQVEKELATRWGQTRDEASERIQSNFSTLLQTIKGQ